MNGDLAAVLALGGSAFLIGLTGAMAPGPYLTLTITRTVTRGARSAALMLAGHALLEALLLVAFAFGLQTLLAGPQVSRALSVTGGAFLLWMAIGLLRGAIRGTIHPSATVPNERSRLGPIFHGAAVSASNPYWWLWWATVGAKLASDGLALGPAGVLAFFVGHELADVAWYGLVIVATSRGRHLLADRPYRIIIGTCALFLVYLGARFLLGGLGLT